VIGLYSTVNLTLSGKLDSMIYYPIANGGAMLLTVLVSVIVFKERFDKQKITGTIIGLLGILCLSIPV
jgi:multidrug transporter EmrE-like cation transporter